jgi:hypothetical protein
MRDSTSANTKRAEQAHPLKPLEDGRVLECAGSVWPGLIARYDGKILVGADNPPRVVNLALGGDAATASDAAAWGGRGVAGLPR